MMLRAVRSSGTLPRKRVACPIKSNDTFHFLHSIRKTIYRHWNLQEPTVQQTAPSTFHVKMSATYDGGESKVATAQGTVRCLKSEVRVENYTYVVN